MKYLEYYIWEQLSIKFKLCEWMILTLHGVIVVVTCNHLLWHVCHPRGKHGEEHWGRFQIPVLTPPVIQHGNIVDMVSVRVFGLLYPSWPCGFLSVPVFSVTCVLALLFQKISPVPCLLTFISRMSFRVYCWVFKLTPVLGCVNYAKNLCFLMLTAVLSSFVFEILL